MKKGSSIEIRNLCKSYGDRTLFQDFNCSIGEGEFVVITGSSGCGKTTLLNMIGGLEPVTGGTILIDGLDITRRSRRAKDCGRESEDGRAVNQFRALLKEKTLERIA